MFEIRVPKMPVEAVLKGKMDQIRTRFYSCTMQPSGQQALVSAGSSKQKYMAVLDSLAGDLVKPTVQQK